MRSSLGKSHDGYDRKQVWPYSTEKATNNIKANCQISYKIKKNQTKFCMFKS